MFSAYFVRVEALTHKPEMRFIYGTQHLKLSALVAKSTEGITQMFVILHASAGTGIIPGGLHLGKRRPRVRQGDANPGPGVETEAGPE